MQARTVFVFGNPLLKEDSTALEAAKALKGKIKNVRFVEIDSLFDLKKIPKELIILDAAVGVKKPCVVPLEKIVRTKAVSGHDLDLSLELLLLKKLGKIRKATIVAVPQKLKNKNLREIETIIKNL